ncbi:MAG: DNA primase, partial [Candidatus Caenarcaniphilales bacterium]|nr:DNA primase [Candidatus Caenarcaniphilales bacterium]
MPVKSTFQEALNEIKNRFDILSIVSRYITLKKAGNSYVALCPFHADKSPSMHVSPSKGIFKCFSCGASGDMFKFLIEFKKSNFSEIVHELAEELGIEIFKAQAEPEIPRENKLILEINKATADFFHNNLIQNPDAKEALDYLLEQRKMSQQTISSFGLGFSLSKKTSLLLHLQNKFKNLPEICDKEFLLKTGLFIEDKSSPEPIDRFRGRIMIPIYDLDSQVVAFGARTLDPAIQPKYLNSPETPVYIKSRHLYGMNLARPFAKSEKQVLLLEGYFDVIQAHQYGINYAVGSLGTALTKEQVNLLYQSNLNRKIVFCFDNDEAGKRALKSALQLCQELHFSQKLDLQAISLPGAKDIDEFLLQRGVEQFNELMQQSQSANNNAYNYLLLHIASQTNIEDTNQRSDALRECIDLIQNIADPIDREIQVENCARLLNFQKSTIMELIQTKETRQQNLQNWKNKVKSNNFRGNKLSKSVPRQPERKLVSIFLLTEEPAIIERINSVKINDSLAFEFK